MNIFIFGAGYSAKAFAVASHDTSISIAGTTRSPEKALALQALGIRPFLFDDTLPILDELANTTHLIASVAPDEAGDPILNVFSEPIVQWMPKLEWIGYLSTVGVYGDHQGAWVDEASQCRPVSRRSVMRVEAERAWMQVAEQAAVPLAILRLSGIYGPGRNALVNLENGTAKRLVKPGQVFNRIHVADIAGALWHLALGNIGGVFNVTDDLPAPPQDVVTFAAALMGATPPPEISFDAAQLSPMARSFYGENKRVSNRRLKQTGYIFRYPDYRAAISALWSEGNWRGEGQTDGRSPIKAD